MTAALSLTDATARQLAERLNDTPASSLYRHLALLIEGEIIEVVSTARVGSVEEKTYRLKASESFTAEEIASWTAADYETYFTAAVLSIISSMKDYLKHEPDLKLVKSSTTWQNTVLSVGEERWEQALKEIGTILAGLEEGF